MKRANAAIYFHPEGYSTSGARLMGRQAAGEGFLRAFFQHAEVDRFYCLAPNDDAALAFTQLRDACGRGATAVRAIGPDRLQDLAEPGLLYYPAPGIAEHAWRRRRVGMETYSLCGVTHTISSHSAMDSLAELLHAPLDTHDAVICTSRVVVQAAERLLAAEGEYLKQRLGATRLVHPQLPLIPLGADCEALAPNPEARRAWRERLAIGETDVAFLFVGRLSFHAKANPFPMYLALARAAQRVSVKLHLIQAGWFANAPIEEAFRETARQVCPQVTAHFLDGRDPAVRSGIWHAADCFTSLSDNVQETFGLTPIEAKAAGLPCVVSDWNGYRDTVREGEEGFRIPTCMPSAPSGQELAERHADELDSYDRYIGNSSLSISVDVAACAEAYAALARDANLRRRMGEAGRAHARAEFDWPVIIGRYQELWAELAAIRAKLPKRPRAEPVHPRRPDPFWLFEEYATHRLEPESRFTAAAGAGAQRHRELSALRMLNFGLEPLLSEPARLELLERIARSGPRGLSLAELTAELTPRQAAQMQRTLGWLLKVDLIRRVG